ncbi:MAG: hypothetical protein M1820_001467 [Bogoriella megaspora]|nr:MAG: hypothetical protein M1820_001467 [Bogoriella megaspora]
MSMDSRPEAETDSFWTRFINKIIEAVNIGGFSVTGVGLLAFLTAPLPLALLAYHIHLVWAGMTTNETVKWSDWREDMADGVVFKSKRTPVLGESGRLATDDKVSVEGDASNSHSPESRPNGAQRVDIGGVNVDWPITSDQIIVRTANGQPPGRNPDLWTRCWRLNEVNNLYDLGFWDNMKEVLNG